MVKLTFYIIHKSLRDENITNENSEKRFWLKYNLWNGSEKFMGLASTVFHKFFALY